MRLKDILDYTFATNQPQCVFMFHCFPPYIGLGRTCFCYLDFAPHHHVVLIRINTAHPSVTLAKGSDLKVPFHLFFLSLDTVCVIIEKTMRA